MSFIGPRFTVFTPTYNRARTLPSVYACLTAQTFKDFEWLIVDDGSTDATRTLVESWLSEGLLNIRYIWKENGGKHTATNRGLQEALGFHFLTLDSDDTCINSALESLNAAWESIPEEQRNFFSGITCLCRTEDGKVVGDEFPQNVFDSTPIHVHHVLKVSGEKWGFHRTEILRKFPFPEFDNERFVPESLVWNRVSKSYKVRYINEALRVFTPALNGLTADNVNTRMNSPIGSSLYYRELLEFPLPPGSLLRAAVNFVRFSLHSGRPSLSVGSLRLRLFLFASFPMGLCAYAADRISTRRPSR